MLPFLLIGGALIGAAILGNKDVNTEEYKEEQKNYTEEYRDYDVYRIVREFNSTGLSLKVNPRKSALNKLAIEKIKQLSASQAKDVAEYMMKNNYQVAIAAFRNYLHNVNSDIEFVLVDGKYIL